MPPVNPVPPKAKGAKPAKVRVTVPDAGEETRTQRPTPPTVKVRMYAHPYREQPQKVMRQQVAEQKQEAAHTKRLAKTVAKIHVTPVASPDATDTLRSPAQRQHDAQVAADTVKAERLKVVREQGRGSGTRAVKAWVKSNLHDEEESKTGTVHGHGRLAVIAANLPVAGASLKVFKNAAKDAAELAVTTPSSVAHLATTAVHHPEQIPKELAAPYIDLAKHPIKNATEKPVSTALMLQPLGRVPGRVVGKVARVTGKQTLERPAATLPGTALKETRTGSRDAAVRSHQAKQDAQTPTPTVTAKEVQKRVDHHYDLAKQEAHRIQGEHVKAARAATKGQPKAVRDAAIEAAREQAREVADQVAQERFAREFGANERLSHGVVVREATHAARRQAVATWQGAKIAAKQADTDHDVALANARAARARAKTSPKLASLESRRRDLVRDLAVAQRAQSTARAAHGIAKGRAQVLADKVVDPRSAAAAHGAVGTLEKRRIGVENAGQAITDARARIHGLDRQIADERQRISGVPPAEAQALTHAIHARGQAHATLAVARADAHAAAHTHIAAKRAMTNSTLVSPASEGRLFAHKADAATVVKKLNEAAVPITRGKGWRFTSHEDGPVTFERQGASTAEPLTFVVRQVGDDRWAAVPKVAAQQLTKHQVVGSSPATMAKVMRVSRGAFTNAVLPLSAKWLAGQGVEAGVRSVVAGAGPMDWLRMGKVVKKLNDERPGAGDELAMRVSGGHFDLTGPARDFANGKSLADEFEGTPLAQPAGAATYVGQAAPLKAIRHGWGQYTKAVLGTINHVIESNARRAMAGQAVKNLGFDERHINGLSNAAIEDAANGLKGTHNQVALARAVDRMYGQYQKFSPETRSFLMHWTPFAPWFLNTIKFLGKTLPIDHPVKAALVADASAAEKDWRESHGLSLDGPHVPDFLLGSYPLGGGKSLPLAHYTPFGIGTNVTGSAADLMLPQFLGPLKNTGGVDWKWDPLTHGGSHGPKFNQGERMIRALVTALEEQVPGVSQAGKISGVTPRYVDKNSPDTIKSATSVLKGYLPTTPTSGGSASSSSSGSSSTVVRVKIPGVGSGRVKLPGGVTGRIKIP